LRNTTCFYYYSESSSSSPSHPHSQNQESNTATSVKRRTTKKDPFLKRILIVDDDPDITLTFGVGLEGYYYSNKGKIRFEVYTYNNPEIALSEFKLNFYDLLLADIYMPNMNGLELSQKILELDANIRVCFMSAAEVNIEALREVYPKISFGCFIKKPVTIDYLVKRLLAELD
jgi:CheY-like chemotaxis protein